MLLHDSYEIRVLAFFYFQNYSWILSFNIKMNSSYLLFALSANVEILNVVKNTRIRIFLYYRYCYNNIMQLLFYATTITTITKIEGITM